jgi:peptidyl-prolyl isomerase G (cyclophilin G)
MRAKSKFVHVYMDITIGSKPAGRVIFELFTDTTPLTAENFRGLCTGEYGTFVFEGQTRPLTYNNSEIFKIEKGNFIQGGDIAKNNGSSGHSIYGPKFNDENFQRQHSKAGLLSMATKGRNSNNSQFLVTLKPMPALDGKSVVFGHVIYGMEAIHRIAAVDVDFSGLPKVPVIIIDSGEMDDKRAYITKDPLGLEGMKRIRDANKFNRLFFEEKREEFLPDSNQMPETIHNSKANDPVSEKTILSDKLKENHNASGIDRIIQRLKEKSQDSQETHSHTELNQKHSPNQFTENELNTIQLGKREQTSETIENRLLNLKLKLNQIRAQNVEVVEEEELRNKDPSLSKNEKLNNKKEKILSWTETLKQKNIESYPYLDQPALATTKPESDPLSIIRSDQPIKNFGWNGNVKSLQRR